MCCFRCCEAKLKQFSVNIDKYKLEAETAYSNNIYKEMTIDDLKQEFEKTAMEASDYRTFVDAGQIKRETKAVEHMLQRFDKK